MVEGRRACPRLSIVARDGSGVNERLMHVIMVFLGGGGGGLRSTSR